jgi:hypothetical protein
MGTRIPDILSCYACYSVISYMWVTSCYGEQMRALIIMINAMAMIFGIWFWADNRINMLWEMALVTGSLVIPLANIFFILNYTDIGSQGLLSLFLKRKRLEEQDKIDKLKSEAK